MTLSDRVRMLSLHAPWMLAEISDLAAEVQRVERAQLGRVRGQADLIYRDGQFYLYVVVDVGDVPPGDPSGYLGVDLGQKNIAADSDGETFSGAHVASLRNRHYRLRRKLQKKGTKSALRLLKRRRLKERRFASDVNHRIAKTIVRKARDTDRGIGLEDLKGIRERTTVRKAQRRTHHSWAFSQLRLFLTYKAALAGVPVIAVNPKYTSQTCPCCGSISRANRPTRDRFKCQSCGHAGDADTTAARIIARRAERHAAERRAA